MLVPIGTAPLYGYSGCWKMLDHQHALVAGDDVLGAVAVVHVEVDDRHALQAAHVERVARRDGDVVEEAEAHRLAARRVVARRAHGAEGVLDLAVDHRVGGRHRGAGGAQRRVPGAGQATVSGSSARGSPLGARPARSRSCSSAT